MRASNAMTRVLSLACCDAAPTRPLMDGRIGIEGCTLRPFRLPLDEILHRAYGGAEFDLVELGLGSYSRSVAGGNCPYVALPVFPLRTFRHRDVYVRRDRIGSPSDLAGKRIGLVDYSMTAAVVLRAFLREEFTLDTASMTWVAGGVDTPLERYPQPVAGAAIEAAPQGETLSGLLAAGAIDAVIALRPPACFRERHPAIARLFPDYRKAEAEYFAATGIFPIMHLIAMRRTLAAEPGLARAIYEGFLAAKNYAMAELSVTQAAKITLPWVAAAHEQSTKVLGPDYWSYGIACNRDILTSFLDGAHKDLLTPEPLGLGAVFHPDLLET
jgi:4,5-dihydroxyphthalate decarboxylase